MFHNSRSLFLLALACISTQFVLANEPDKACMNSCNDYSIVLGNCRNQYGNSPIYAQDTANGFLGCLCDGTKADQTLGFDAMNEIVGVCSSCTSTPHTIRKQLEQMITLCAVWKAEGSAEDSVLFTPTSYHLETQY